MEQINDVVVGNPTALLIERIFWLGLGGFLGLAIISSLIRGLNKSKDKTIPNSQNDLENLAKKASKQTGDFN